MDREFFGQVADVVFGNPFSRGREELIRRLLPRTEALSDPEALARVVAQRIERLPRLEGEAREAAGRVDRQRFRAQQGRRRRGGRSLLQTFEQRRIPRFFRRGHAVGSPLR